MDAKEARRARLRLILDAPIPKSETREETKARIRGIIEGSTHGCPHCGFLSFNGGVHPFAGKNGRSKAETRWCNGVITIAPEAGERRFPHICDKCKKTNFYTHTELELNPVPEQCFDCTKEK